MTAEYPQGDEPLIPMPELSLPALRQAVAVVKPSRLPSPSSRRSQPSAAARLHNAERALADPDPNVWDQAVREVAEIVQAPYREAEGLLAKP
jgi:hypothetical protein